MTPCAQIGIIGYGAIGRDLCYRLGREGHRVVLLLRAGSTSRESVPPGLPVVDTVEALIGLRPQLVVEAAGQAVLDRMAEPILRAGVSLIAASTGALADPRLFSRLEVAAREAKTQLVLPAGALGGLDYLAALRGVSDATIRYTSRKPPAAWRAELAVAGHDPARLKGDPRLSYPGTADRAARQTRRHFIRFRKPEGPKCASPE
jgi:aspartate dehydrogenase